MANSIEVANLPASRFVSVTSRYASATVLYYGDRGALTYSTYKITPIVQSTQDRFTVIDKSVEYRPDLVSQTAYGTPDFWWRLMESNGLKDIYEFKAGLNIRIPNAIF